VDIDVSKWMGDTHRWFDEARREQLLRAPELPANDPPAQSPLPRRTTDWTEARIAALSGDEVRRLRANAERLGDATVAGRCESVLADRPSGAGERNEAAPSRAAAARHLVSRSVAFGMSGIPLANRFWSRGGIARDGKVVFAVWAADVIRDRQGARCLLWAPNIDGSRPWSDKPGGRERLEHCRRAAATEDGAASAFLVYGQRLSGVQPEDRAATVAGIDATSLSALRVEKRGAEYWAVWGGG
jgi:hypothetical protein